MSRPSVDLPQPDSPTSPRHSPLRIWKVTPSTALTDAPRRAGKCFTTSSTRTRASVSAGLLAGACRAGGSATLEGPSAVSARGGSRSHVEKLTRPHLLIRAIHGAPARGRVTRRCRLEGWLVAEAAVQAEGAPG